jgi:hypothetical protein
MVMNAKQDLPFEGTACSVVHSQCRKEGMAQASGEIDRTRAQIGVFVLGAGLSKM